MEDFHSKIVKYYQYQEIYFVQFWISTFLKKKVVANKVEGIIIPKDNLPKLVLERKKCHPHWLFFFSPWWGAVFISQILLCIVNLFFIVCSNGGIHNYSPKTYVQLLLISRNFCYQFHFINNPQNCLWSHPLQLSFFPTLFLVQRLTMIIMEMGRERGKTRNLDNVTFEKLFF